MPYRFSKDNQWWTSPQFIGAMSLGAAMLLLLIYYVFFKKRETPTPPVKTVDFAKTNTSFPTTEISAQQTSSPIATEVPPLSNFNRRSTQQIQQLLYAGDAKTFYQSVYREIKNTFAKRMGVQANTLTTDQIAGWMAANGYDTARIADLRFLFQICEQALYAGQEHIAEMEFFFEKAKQFIQP